MQPATCEICGAAIAGPDVLYTADARTACRACYDKADLATAGTRASGLGLAGVGAVAALIPFFVHISASSTASVNGEIVSETSRDYIALACGLVAIVLGALTAGDAVRAKQRGAALAVPFVAIALGAYQVAHGLGAI